MTPQPKTPSSATPSLLQAYTEEFGRLSEAIVAILDIMDRRSDLNSPSDGQTLTSLSACLAQLSTRVEERRGRAAGQASDGGTSQGTNPTAPPAVSPQTPHAPAGANPELGDMRRRLSALAGPAVHATVADTISGGFLDRGTEYSSWMQRPMAKPKTAYTTGHSHNAGRTVTPTPVARPATSGSPTTTSAPGQRTLADLEQALLALLKSEPTLRGTSQSMPLPRVFDLLVRFRRTGCLHVRSTDEHLCFVFVDGMVVATSSDNQPIAQRLGEILEQMGVIPRRHLQSLLDRCAREQKPLGRLLVDEQFLSIPQLVRALTIQVHARLERAYYATRAAFAFVPTTGELIDDHVRVNATAVLSDLKERPQDGPGNPPTESV
ncbi:MAG: DUF4388 domain-containing protein [Planctomycetota bacterium]